MDRIEDTRIAVTGSGICSAIGQSPAEVVESLAQGKSGIAPFGGDQTERMVSQYAARISDFTLGDDYPESLNSWWDRATQMAAKAAGQATANSGALSAYQDRCRIGLAVGMSGAGQFSPSRSATLDGDGLTHEIAELLVRRNVPHFQTYQLARWLRLSGPTVTVCSASAGSGIAIGNAVRWLLANRADCVLAGGGEAIQLLNFLGFDTLGLLSPNPCSPFSRCEGMTMGEGAAFLVLERYSDAVQRGADIHGVLYGFGVSSDAFDPILFDPSGDGIRRAISIGLRDAGVAENEVGWIRASGAGGKDQDASEVMAIRAVFGDKLPLVSSTEAHHGHCNGAGPAMGFLAAMEAQRQSVVPATLNFEQTNFEGLDFVPNNSRSAQVDRYLSTTAAFGGSNVVLVGGQANGNARSRDCDEVVITGLGVVSGFGCAGNDFARHLSQSSGIGPIDRRSVGVEGVDRASLVHNFSLRREVPSIPSRGLDLLTQYATAATARALSESQAGARAFDADRLGVVTGLKSTSGNMLDKLLNEIQGPWATPTIGRTLLNKGRFLVTSRLAHWFSCKSYNATYSAGIGAGQLALNQAYEHLRQCPELDAIVVVSADEVTRLHLMLTARLGWLADASGSMLPFDPQSAGMILGEGAVAIVLERKQSAGARNVKPIATMKAVACSLDDMPFADSFEQGHARGFQLQAEGPYLEAAMRDCLRKGYISADQVDVVLGTAFGIPEVDQREQTVVRRTLRQAKCYGSLARLTGATLSSGSLLNTALCAAAFQDQRALEVLQIASGGQSSLQAPPLAAMVIASSEDGHNLVTLLSP